MLLVILAAHKALLAVKERGAELSVPSDNANFADDVSIVCRLADLPELIVILAVEFAKIGWSLKFNFSDPTKSKNKLYSTTINVPDFQEWFITRFAHAEGMHFVPRAEGIIIMGIPYGSEEFVQRRLDETMADLRKECIAATRLYSPQDAYFILRLSTIAKARHFFRFLPMDSAPVTRFATAIDELILTTWDTLLGYPAGTIALHPTAIHLLQLPVGLGGMGFTSAHVFGDAALIAAILTVKRIREHLFVNQPQVCFPFEHVMVSESSDADEDRPLASGVAANFQEQLSGRALALVEAFNRLHPSLNAPVDLRTLTTAHVISKISNGRTKKENPKLQRALTRSRMRRQMSLFARSRSFSTEEARTLRGGSMRKVLFSTVPTTGRLGLGASQFRSYMATLLHTPQPLLIAGAAVKCPCGQTVDTYGDHIQSCPRLSGQRTRRHHDMAASIEELYNSTGFHTVREDASILAPAQHLNTRPSQEGTRMDISGVHATTGERVAIDVTIGGSCHPTQAANKKIQHYSAMCNALGIHLVVPAFSVHGEWTEDFSCELDRLAQLQESQTGKIPAELFRSYWEQVLATHLARVVAQHQVFTITKLRQEQDVRYGRITISDSLAEFLAVARPRRRKYHT